MMGLQTDAPAPHPGNGIFITFEGGERVGKSTQIHLLKERLQTHTTAAVTVTFEPGGTALGQQLRNLLQHGPQDVDPRTEALLFAADRAYHVATFVRPRLEAGQVVLCDRFLDSSVAYQGGGRGLGDAVQQLSLWATRDLVPDLTILLDGDPETLARRQLGPEDRLERESMEFHRQVRQRFLQIAKQDPQRVKVIDALGTQQQVSQQVWDAALPELRKKGLVR